MPTKECGEPADYRYTWPGAGEDYACFAHGREIARIAHAMGFYLQLIVLTPTDPPQICKQQVKEEDNAN